MGWYSVISDRLREVAVASAWTPIPKRGDERPMIQSSEKIGHRRRGLASRRIGQGEPPRPPHLSTVKDRGSLLGFSHAAFDKIICVVKRHILLIEPRKGGSS